MGRGAEHTRAIRAHNGLRVLPDYAFSSCPAPDILVISGGYGARSAMHQAAVVEWVEAQAQQAEQVLGICTGAFILASAGLLDGRKATTQHDLLNHLEEIAPKARVCERRVVAGGKILTSGGIPPGMDLSLHVVWTGGSGKRRCTSALRTPHERPLNPERYPERSNPKRECVCLHDEPERVYPARYACSTALPGQASVLHLIIPRC